MRAGAGAQDSSNAGPGCSAAAGCTSAAVGLLLGHPGPQPQAPAPTQPGREQKKTLECNGKAASGHHAATNSLRSLTAWVYTDPRDAPELLVKALF